MGAKIGRPKIETPKDAIIKCRVTSEFSKRLDEYCKENNVSKTDVIVRGVEIIIKKK